MSCLSSTNYKAISFINMAVVPLCCKISHIALTLPATHFSKGSTCECPVNQEGFRWVSSISNNIKGRQKIVHPIVALMRQRGGNFKAIPDSTSQKDNLGPMWCAMESKSGLKHIRSLESYLEKLQNEAKQLPPNAVNDMTELDDIGGLLKNRKGLRSLDKYLAALSDGVESENYPPSASSRNSGGVAHNSVIKNIVSGNMRRVQNFARSESMKSENHQKKAAVSHLENESSDLYLISILASINIAVFLFELASPINNSDNNLCSLPLMYGAKVNHLILVGEWWRLLTPMFLHSGLLHIALSCWVLLSFGPQVCKGYGSFTFFLIYILGGISGNLASFLHTPEPTVGGSGPTFAIIGAWLIYQVQNKDVITKEISEQMFQKATVAATLSCVLGSFVPIDNWAHFGAAFTGIIYGFFTCPRLQANDSTTDAMQEEGIALITQHSNPCKPLIIFTVFILTLSSLIFFAEPPLSTTELEDHLQISE
ncbi:hypothetical protein Ancab_034727 [Ancistrocladus abbreviatus]